ncbi:hypothetical protein [Winogradskyella sp. 3972H.M.0a.05]|uniref:hypothetical protein n=1 Tax=Winogradskyella sp. 3972H.M.0a.05 TaxID=2950277 RepID=UPI0033936B1D
MLLLLCICCFQSCKKSSDYPAEDPIIKFWSITHLQFNDDPPITLDKCTSEDYLDIRKDHIALSYHCEYSKLDSIPSYHIHKLNWKRKVDKTYSVYSDDESMKGVMRIDSLQQLHLQLNKTGGRVMKATFK